MVFHTCCDLAIMRVISNLNWIIFNMNYHAIIQEILKGSFNAVLLIFAILIPLMIILELIHDAGLLERLALIAEPVMKLFKLPKEAILPIYNRIYPKRKFKK